MFTEEAWRMMDHYTYPKMMEEILLIACTIPITERIFHLAGKIFPY
jgi:hypothetical protein